MSLEDPAAGASPDDTGGRPADSPDGTYLAVPVEPVELDAGLSKTSRADTRVDGAFVGAAGCRVGVLSFFEGGWKRLPKGDALTGVASGEMPIGVALRVGVPFAISAAGVETGLTVSRGTPDANAFASLRFNAFALALAILSSVA